LGTDDAQVRVEIHVAQEGGYSAGEEFCVWIQPEHIPAPRRAQARIDPSGEAEVGGVNDQPGAWALPTHEFRASVRRRVIDDTHFVIQIGQMCRDGGKAPLEERRGVIAYDDHRELHLAFEDFSVEGFDRPHACGLTVALLDPPAARAPQLTGTLRLAHE